MYGILDESYPQIIIVIILLDNIFVFLKLNQDNNFKFKLLFFS